MAVEVGRLGGLGVLNAEGLWARHADPQSVIDEIVGAADEDADPDELIRMLQEAYSAPVSMDLLG